MTMTKAKISLDAIKALREKTGAPMGDVKSALEQAGGDTAKAVAILREKGFEAAKKRAERATHQGRVEGYLHHNGQVGALVEVNCESDFVARSVEFQQFCKDVAMHVVAMNPACVRKEELSASQLEDAKQHGRTAEELAKEACLLEQPALKDQSQTVGQILAALIGQINENIVIRRFVRFSLGEESRPSSAG